MTTEHDLLQDLSRVLQDLTETYSSLPKVIANETQAISGYDISGVQATCKQKEDIAKQIHDQVRGSAKLVKSLVDGFELTPGEDLSFEQLVYDLRHSQKLANRPDLLPIMGKLQVQVKYLANMVADIQPSIEKNRFVLEHLLLSYQNSFQFWQDMVAAESASYTAGGTRAETSGSGSGFFVKA